MVEIVFLSEQKTNRHGLCESRSIYLVDSTKVTHASQVDITLNNVVQIRASLLQDCA